MNTPPNFNPDMGVGTGQVLSCAANPTTTPDHWTDDDHVCVGVCKGNLNVYQFITLLRVHKKKSSDY